MELNFRLLPKQKQFVEAESFEVFFGGAASGGKSYAQIIDAFLYALKYPKSKQIIFRRSYVDLEHSLIRSSRDIYPTKICTYNVTQKKYTFNNGSIIDFGYLADDNDVYQYKSAEYDIIRFDELSEFTLFQYTYMISRCRGVNPFPRHIKSSSNPGNIWVKERFIDPMPPNTEYKDEWGNTRIFIPSNIFDNKFMTELDPNYVKRLEMLPESEKRMLLYGDWLANEGQFFKEWKVDIHTCDPFVIPDWWTRYRAVDYGLDCAACVWAAFDDNGECYIYREYGEPNKIISDASKDILDLSKEDGAIMCTYAPADLWSRSRESGKARADIFAENGLPFVCVRQSRESGWANIHEYLRIINGEARLHIFNNCRNLIKYIPALQIDDKNCNDVESKRNHQITHLPDALRYLLSSRPLSGEKPKLDEDYEYRPLPYDIQVDSFTRFGK